MDALTSVQDIEDARTIPFRRFVDHVTMGKIGPTPASDDIGFFMRDNLTATSAFKVFVDRVDAAVKNGDPDATAAASIVQAELKGGNGN